MSQSMMTMTTMTAEVRSYRGRVDGFRYGELLFSDGEWRHYLFDRLNNTIRLWRQAKHQAPTCIRQEEDLARLNAAKAAISACDSECLRASSPIPTQGQQP